MHTYVVFRKSLFIKTIIFIIICGSLGVASTSLFKLRFVSIILLAIMIAPIFAINMLLKKFTWPMDIQLGSDNFSTTIVKSENNKVKRDISLSDVKSYVVQAPNNNFSTIKFILKSGLNIEYSFLKKLRNDKDMKPEEIINCFHSLIKKHNDSSDKNVIELQPSFFASNAGLVCIVGLSVLLSFAIVFASLLNANSLPLSLLFAFMIIIQLILRRSKELAVYNQLLLNNAIETDV